MHTSPGVRKSYFQNLSPVKYQTIFICSTQLWKIFYGFSSGCFASIGWLKIITACGKINSSGFDTVHKFIVDSIIVDSSELSPPISIYEPWLTLSISSSLFLFLETFYDLFSSVMLFISWHHFNNILTFLTISF